MLHAAKRVLILDEQTLLTDLIRTSLSVTGKYVVSCAASLCAATDLLNCPETPPFDIILLDTQFGKPLTVRDVAHIAELCAPVQVVLFAAQADKAFIDRCVAVGAFGFVPKTLSFQAFESVLDFILTGQMFIPADLGSTARGHGAPDPSLLNPCEIRVLEKISVGMSNKEITDSLSLPESTVKLRVRSICRKLGAANRTQALVNAQRHGLVN